MKFAILLGAAMAALPAVGANDGVLHIDGGSESGWEDGWYVQVDGVMGGKSSGKMEFLQDNSVMKFTGDINLDGGGFSSVRRRVSLDLSDYAGVVVTLEADRRSVGEVSLPPIGLELQFDDRSSRYDFSSAFSVPLSSDDGDGPVVSSVYLPIESFDRGTFIGFVCRDNCQFDPSKINGISVYVLFQKGIFDVRLRSIEAVKEPRSFPLPKFDVIESKDDVIALIQSTITAGGGLYDKGYTELCIAMYWSVLNTILSSDTGVVSDAIQAVLCAGLQQVETQTNERDNKENIAWTLRHAMDALIADLQGFSRLTVQDWLPTVDEATSMKVQCLGRTSAAPGYMYDPTNQYMLEMDDDAIGNSTLSYQDVIEEAIAKREEAMQELKESGGFAPAATTFSSFSQIVSAVLGIAFSMGVDQLV